jgi:PleD family two-component response regulator
VTPKNITEVVEKKAEASVKGGTETILVAEDHDDLREAAKEILKSLGYGVLLAATGEQAVEIFEANCASIGLPGAGGMWFAVEGDTPRQLTDA